MELQFVPGDYCLAGEHRRESRRWHVSGKERKRNKAMFWACIVYEI